ncbi:MAG TPA: MBL fold metallo-hydrolase [Hyphomonadaceae bacterium]|jgi:hypothetical protein|nr:MBL fold metallo-hydrolase [Hyphomonadaceae bacterium]
MSEPAEGVRLLETTFLGHQGWQFATANTRILVDPLLVEPFGHGGAVGVVYPPRVLDVLAMAPVDAVIFTHEHEDHFNIPSLNRISRDIPIYAPERSSLAMRRFLEEAGFTVRLMAAGQTIKWSDLHFSCFAPDHLRHEEQDEWETMLFLVEDMKDGGSFFSPVDVTVPAAVDARLRQRGASPSLWGYANNVMNMSFQEQPSRAAPAVEPIIARFVAEHRRRPPPSVASLMCGDGFSFTGPRAWMNHAFFPLDSDQLFNGLQEVTPSERFIVPVPGMQITVDKDRIAGISQTSPFLRTLPRAQWPDRTYKPKALQSADAQPASGRTALGPGELDELTDRLADFAAFLYGGPLFRALYSLGADALPAGVRPSFAIGAMDDTADNVFEYDPAGCRFELLKQPVPLSQYVAGLECFASDLLDFLRGRLAPSALMFGRACRWRGSGENLTPAIDRAIWTYGHPLRRQAEYLDLYRSLYALEPRDVPKVPSRASVS